MVGSKENTEDGDKVVMKINIMIIERKSKAGCGNANDKDLSQDHDKVSHLVHKEASHYIGCYHVECILESILLLTNLTNELFT